MDKINAFHAERKAAVEKMKNDGELKRLTEEWSLACAKYDYVYNMTWMGAPILQLSTDIVALQELIWKVQPDLIIETGLAYGGSIIFTASMLELLGGNREVIGIDIDIREHNRKAIESHPMYKNIHLIEGSSTDECVYNQVLERAKGRKKIMVILDSNHSHEHVLNEMKLYGPMVGVESYLIVFDTIIEFSHDKVSVGREDRPWGVGNNPWTAVQEFCIEHQGFEVDSYIQDKIVVTSAPGGYLKRVR